MSLRMQLLAYDGQGFHLVEAPDGTIHVDTEQGRWVGVWVAAPIAFPPDRIVAGAIQVDGVCAWTAIEDAEFEPVQNFKACNVVVRWSLDSKAIPGHDDLAKVQAWLMNAPADEEEQPA